MQKVRSLGNRISTKPAAALAFLLEVSMSAKPETKRPDTTDMYQFIWFTESGLPLECYLYFHEPDPAGHFFPGGDSSMELMHAMINGHDIADILTIRACQDIEKMALLDATKKNLAARTNSQIWQHIPDMSNRSLACFLG